MKVGGWSAIFGKVAVFTAILAVAVNVLVPAGFMPGAPGAPGLVLCTGHGPVQIASDLTGLSKASGSHDSKSHADGPCAFTGHGAAPPLAVSPFLSSEAATWLPFVEHSRQAFAVAPFLAAPPPPSHAPPSVSV
jgi:hypothetical protein